MRQAPLRAAGAEAGVETADPAPFAQVVEAYGSVVLRACRAMLGPADADDAWSETFLSALRAYPDLRPNSNVRAWLLTIAHHKVIDLVRARDRRAVPTAELPELPATRGRRDGDTEAKVIAAEPLDDQLQRALAALPPKQRGAVTYRHLADLSYAEIGALLDCSPQAARRNVADGIAAMRRRLGAERAPERRAPPKPRPKKGAT